MKKLILTLIFLLLISSISFASPLMDFSQGKVSLDLNYRISPDGEKISKYSILGNPQTVQGPLTISNYLEWGATVGLGNNWGIQYRQFNPDFEIVELGNMPASIDSREFNVLYKLDKNLAAFAGIVRSNATARYYGDQKSNTEDVPHIGLVASKQIADKTKAYGLFSLGNDYRSLEMGLSYDISKQLELNVNYRNVKFDSFLFKNPGVFVNNISCKDVKLDSFGAGITYKF